jgi:hypothetical protein
LSHIEIIRDVLLEAGYRVDQEAPERLLVMREDSGLCVGRIVSRNGKDICVQAAPFESFAVRAFTIQFGPSLLSMGVQQRMVAHSPQFGRVYKLVVPAALSDAFIFHSIEVDGLSLFRESPVPAGAFTEEAIGFALQASVAKGSRVVLDVFNRGDRTHFFMATMMCSHTKSNPVNKLEAQRQAHRLDLLCVFEKAGLGEWVYDETRDACF